ncbi:MAG: single-stranded-DNA-specific exonuclease RecJ [bacterium]
MKYPLWQSRNAITTETKSVEEYLLLQRNIHSSADISQFFSDSIQSIQGPASLKGALEAAGKIVQAMKRNDPIAIYGDYDVDGVTALTILYEIFQNLGYEKIIPYLPHRESEGYGLNAEALHKLAKQGVKMVITVDCGINANHEAKVASELGLELIITDHHHVPANLPDVSEIINPKQPGCPSAFKELAGAGVAWKLGWALLAISGKDGSSTEMPAFSREQLDLLAIATVADIVPLLGENRIIVKHGLAQIKKNSRPGIKALLDVSGTAPESVNEDSIGFRIGPRINASGRLDYAYTSFELLTATSQEKADELARKLDDYNKERQALTQKCLAEAMDQIDKDNLSKVIMVKHPEWPSGIIGLLASKICDQYHRPAIAMSLTKEQWRGSARSYDFFHITNALTETAEHLVRFGGHATAAGFSVTPEKITSFEEQLLSLATNQIEAEMLTPTLFYDMPLNAPQLNWNTHKVIEKFSPFGFQNTRPLIMSDHLELFDIKIIGKQKNHVRYKFLSDKSIIDGIAFNFTDHIDPTLHIGDPVEVAYHLESNEWNGYKNLQMNIVDLRKKQ